MSKQDSEIYPSSPSDPLKRLLLYCSKMLEELKPELVRRYYPSADFFSADRLREDVHAYMKQYGIRSYTDLCISDKGKTRDCQSSLPYRLLPIDASTLRNYLRCGNPSGSSRKHRPSAAVQCQLCEFFHRPYGYYCTPFPDDDELVPMMLTMMLSMPVELKREQFVNLNLHFQAGCLRRKDSSEHD